VTYAEAEESEADLDRFRSWLTKIESGTTSQSRWVTGPRGGRRGGSRAGGVRGGGGAGRRAPAALAPMASAAPEPVDSGGERRGPAGRLRALE
jgi:hypothetical protein